MRTSLHTGLGVAGDDARSEAQRDFRRSVALVIAKLALVGRLLISDVDRSRGIAIHAGSGSGKSVVMGKVICFQDLVRGIPQVVLDPLGPLVDSLLLSVLEQPLERRQELLSRIIYVEMSGTGERVVGFPLLWRLPTDNLRDVADRFLESLRKLDPHLQGASIQGWNSVVHVGRPTLMVMAALGRPITDALALLREPEAHRQWLQEAMAADKEAAPAVAFFRREYLPMQHRERMALAGSLMVKLDPFALDPAMSAMFTATEPGVDLAEAVAKGYTILLDFRHENNVDRRRFKTRWVFEWFMAYVRHRGITDDAGLGFVVDELTELTNQSALEHDLFAVDLDILINQYARNCRVFATLAHQELFQLSEQTQKTLLSCGNQILGLTDDKDAGKYLAEQFFSLDPYHVKRVENVWGSAPGGMGSVVVEEREAYMALDEQIHLGAQALMQLRPFEFFVKRRNQRALTKVSLLQFVAGPRTDEYREELSALRAYLAARVGPRRPAPLDIDVPANQPHSLDTMKGNAIHEQINHLLDQSDADYWNTEFPVAGS